MYRPGLAATIALCEMALCVWATNVVAGSFTRGRRRELLHDALNMGQDDVTSRECVYSRDSDSACSLGDVDFHYYSLRHSGDGPKYSKQRIEFTSPAWLHSSGWDHSMPTVLIVHGYGGASKDYLPGAVLRDAYLDSGKYNVFMVDWSKLSALPCYAAAVHNMKTVAKCVATMLAHLRTSGLNVDQLTCVGHSLGAHVCGIVANYLPFRMHRIIGVDPAKPLIRNRASGRLDPGDADVVQILHATARYGDLKRMGHVDFCLNGGHVQPICMNVSNTELCSHARSVCYLAESLDPNTARKAEPCSRRCLQFADRDSIRPVVNSFGRMPYVVLGEHTPDEVRGVYCVTNSDAPYCSKTNVRGSPHCCPPSSQSPHADTAVIPIGRTQHAAGAQQDDGDDGTL